MEHIQQESHFHSGPFDQLGYRALALAKSSFEVFRSELEWLGSNISQLTKMMGGVLVLLPILLMCLTTGFIALAVSRDIRLEVAAFSAAGFYAVVLGVFVWVASRSASAKEHRERFLSKRQLSKDFQTAKEELQETFVEVKNKTIEAVNPMRIVKQNPEPFVIGSFAAGLLLAAFASSSKEKK